MVANGSFRWLLNMGVDTDGRRARRAGWDSLSYGGTPRNTDLHDQRDCLAPPGVFEPEPIVMLHSAVSQSQERRLYAATKSRYYMQQGTGWKTIGRGFRGTAVAGVPRAAQLGDDIVFTNGVDKPMLHTFGTSPQECVNNYGTLEEIKDLGKTVDYLNVPIAPNTGIGLTRAKLVVSFNGCIFLMDTFELGKRYASRVRWSGFNAPKIWRSGPSTLAGFQDLPYDEAITCAAELANVLYVFTNRSMYKCLFNGVSFSFERVFSEVRAQSTLPAFPNSLISDGVNLWWVADDGIYQYNIYVASGTRPVWMHNADKRMMDSMNRACCQSVTAGFNPETHEVWWSYPSGGGCINNECLVANTVANSVDYVDHGFTAFSNIIPDTRQTLGDWLDMYCRPVASVGGNVSNFESLCTNIGAEALIEDFCEACSEAKLFIAASAQDNCLKNLSPVINFGPVYHRSRCINPERIGSVSATTGEYEPSAVTYDPYGYISILRGTFPFGNMEGEKVVRRLLLEAKHRPIQGDVYSGYANIRLRVGTSYSALDPNPTGSISGIGFPPEVVPNGNLDQAPGSCEVIWRTAGLREIGCSEKGTTTNVQHLAANTVPNLGFEWPLMEVGRFLHYEISVVGKGPDSPYLFTPTGGAVSFSRIEVQALLKPRT